MGYCRYTWYTPCKRRAADVRADCGWSWAAAASPARSASACRVPPSTVHGPRSTTCHAMPSPAPDGGGARTRRQVAVRVPLVAAGRRAGRALCCDDRRGSEGSGRDNSSTVLQWWEGGQRSRLSAGCLYTVRAVGACRRALQRPAASCAHTTQRCSSAAVSGQPDRGWRWRWYGGWALRATHNAQRTTLARTRLSRSRPPMPLGRGWMGRIGRSSAGGGLEVRCEQAYTCVPLV